MKDAALYSGMFTILLFGLGHWGKTKSGEEIGIEEIEKDQLFRISHHVGYIGAFVGMILTILFGAASQIQ